MSKKSESMVLNNFRSASFQMKCSLQIGERVTSMTVCGINIFLGIAGGHCLIFRFQNNTLEFVKKFNVLDMVESSSYSPKSANCNNIYEMYAFGNYLLYLKEVTAGCTLYLHRISDIMDDSLSPLKSLQLCRKAPVVVEPSLGLIALGGAAWLPMSWTEVTETTRSNEDIDDSWVCMLSLPGLDEIHRWKSVNNSVALLRIQLRNSESLLGVADTRAGLKVYDLRHRESNSKDYVVLYEVPAEEIRTFEIVGEFVAIFHKFEANVSLWHMRQQRTILCINIQDQMRELTLTDDEDDCGLCRDEDDSVTTATSIALDGDHLLVYGTRSGTLSGMSVGNRCKLFAIPCPNEESQMRVENELCESKMNRNDVQYLCFMPPGKLVVYYEKNGLTLLDFQG